MLPDADEETRMHDYTKSISLDSSLEPDMWEDVI